jgi:methylglutaconyl-CoA hydratase
MYETISVESAGRIGRIWLDRPQVHNAFNAVMIRELRGALAALRDDARVRVVVLSGRGRSFCAGADLNWMREIVRYSYEQNLEESTALADFLFELYAFPKPTIARVAGAAIGGGAGFLSACDIVVAEEGTQFGLSEVKIGLVPACIAPYVVRRTGEGRARRYFLTGERFGAGRAAEIGLADDVAPAGGLDAKVDAIAALLLSSGPEALAKCKELLRRVPGMDFAEAKAYTAEMIAHLRVSPEGQEGMAAFLEKRKPKWTA